MPGRRASSHIFSGESTPTGLASSETKVVANWTKVIALFECDSSSQLKFIYYRDIISLWWLQTASNSSSTSRQPSTAAHLVKKCCTYLVERTLV